MRIASPAFLALLLAACVPQGTQGTGYHHTQTIFLPGSGGWDLMEVDEAARRVYVSHESRVDVLDADAYRPVGRIDDLKGAHGIAVAPEFGRGFVTNGKADAVTVFDLKTLAVVGSVKTGKKPDSIVYDPATKRVLAFNSDGGSATVIDARRGRKIGIIRLGGAPEFAVADAEGHVFVNLEDKDELLKLDSRKLKVLARWSVAPGKTPTSLAMDRKNHRLFIGCRNRALVVMDADNGHAIASLPLGERVDATMFDAAAGLVISSNGDGTLTIIRQQSPDQYRVEETVVTKKGSKTFALDSKAHRLFVPVAEFGPVPAPTKEKPKPRPPIMGETFRVFVYEK